MFTKGSISSRPDDGIASLPTPMPTLTVSALANSVQCDYRGCVRWEQNDIAHGAMIGTGSRLTIGDRHHELGSSSCYKKSIGRRIFPTHPQAEHELHCRARVRPIASEPVQ
jgi:hypothetical protein